MKFTFKAHQGLDGYKSIASDWQELAATLVGDCAFQHRPEWYLSFLESGACDTNKVWFVTARTGSSLSAVVPLQYQNYHIGPFTPRLLGTIEDDQMQMSDFVFTKNPSNASLMLQLISWLRTQKSLKWDGLRLRKVPENSAIAYSSNYGLPRGSQIIQNDASCYFDTSGTADNATRLMSKNLRRDILRQLRRAEEKYQVRIESISEPSEINVAFRHFVNVEASGWKGDSGLGSAINCQPLLLNFYQALANHFGARGECIINLLWLDSNPIAAQFGFKIGRTLHIMKFGFAEAFSRFAPGNSLLLGVIERACEDPQTDIVNLVNNPPWSRRFGPLSIGVRSYFISNLTFIGQLTLLGLLGKRALENWKKS